LPLVSETGAGAVAAALVLVGTGALGGRSACGDEGRGGPSRTATTSVSLDRATIWQDTPPQTTGLTVFSASHDFGSVSVFARLGIVDDRSAGESRAWGVSNPAVGAIFKTRWGGHLQLALLAGTTVPVGSGGGDAPTHPDALQAMLNGTDWGGPMFGPNHLDVFEGFRLTATVERLTLRLRSTLHPALRVRATKTDRLGPRVIFTSSGLFAGYTPLAWLSIFGELAETRFLNRPAFLGADPAGRSDHYAVAGLALDFPVGGVRHLQPTISFARAIDAPKRKRAFRLAEIELQFSF
jgi:hypothetical protein